LDKIRTENDISELYKWIWNNQKSYAKAINSINTELNLTGKSELKKDLPCLTIGGTKGVIVVSANPGWNEEINKKEDEYCRKSAKNYVELMRHFFCKYHDVVGKKITWWSKALFSIRFLDNYSSKSSLNTDRWKLACDTQLVGGWELFPFHSDEDGLTQKIDDCDWLKNCAKKSLAAALRLKPQVIFVASKQGAALINEVLPKNHNFYEQTIKNGSSRVPVRYIKLNKNTEIITIPYQIFSAVRKFTNDDILSAVEKMRTKFRNKSN
jgi:hypothetical protein